MAEGPFGATFTFEPPERLTIGISNEPDVLSVFGAITSQDVPARHQGRIGQVKLPLRHTVAIG